MTPRRESGPKLGELLAARGKLDRAVLLGALRQQRMTGGRLGTCLLELDAVGEDDLLHVLSDQLKVPFVESDELRAIPPEVLRLVPVKVAAARGAVPVRASGTQLTVAMLDPHDLAGLDELAFVSGRRIRPHTALEVRIQEALGRAYGVDIPSRFVKLIDRLNRARFLWREEAETGATDAPPAHVSVYGAPPEAAADAPPSPYPPLPARAGERRAPPPVPPPPGAAPVSTPPSPVTPPAAASAEPSPEELARAAPAEPAPAASAPERAREPLAFEQAALRLQAPAGRDEVADCLIEYAASRVDVALVLMVRRREALAWRAATGIDAAAFDALRVRLDEPSVVHALGDGAPLHRGPLPPLSGNEPLRELLGAEIGDLLALPLRVRERLVGALIVAVRRGTLAPELASELQRLAARGSAALELMVLRQKRARS